MLTEQRHDAAQVAFIPAELSQQQALPVATTCRIALLVAQEASLIELMPIIKTGEVAGCIFANGTSIMALPYSVGDECVD